MSPKFWEYYLAIEEDLATCSRYVDFGEQNYTTYSIEFAKIIVLASAEIDTILRELCELISPGAGAHNISTYYTVLTSKYPNIVDKYVKIRRAHLNLQPWKDWTAEKSPDWWGQGYNKIKHDRTNNFNKANLLNALQAVGALHLVILYYHKFASPHELTVDINRMGKLFSPETPEEGLGGMFMVYGMPD